jgi:osmotically-inducible protein OsmY
MKKLLLILSLLSLALVGCSKKQADVAVDNTKAAATDMKNAVSDKMVEWKLTPSDIKADLDKGARVVRTKTVAAGEKVASAADNARIVTVINGKLLADSELSVLKINVDADAGVVTLKGTAKNPDAIGKAILHALDTDGVTQVISLMTVQP